MSKVPFWKTIGAAYAFAFGRFGTVLRVMWLPVVIWIVGAYFIFEPVFAHLAPHLGASGHIAAQQEVISLFGQILPRMLWFLLLWWFVSAQIVVGLTRAAWNPDFRQPAFFSLGRHIWLMMGALFIYGVVYFVSDIILEFARGAIGLGVLSQSQDVQTYRLVDGLVGFVFGVVLFYISLRLGFFLAPVIVAEGKIDLERIWRLSHGNVWRLVGISLGIFLPVVILFVVAMIVLFLPIIMAFVPGAGLHAGTGILPTSPAYAVGSMTFAFVAFAIYFVAIYALQYGASAYAYRALVPPPKPVRPEMAPAPVPAPEPKPAPASPAPAVVEPVPAPRPAPPPKSGPIGGFRR